MGLICTGRGKTNEAPWFIMFYGMPEPVRRASNHTCTLEEVLRDRLDMQAPHLDRNVARLESKTHTGMV
jgi:hypothetical protein